MNDPFALHIRRPALRATLGIFAVALACMALPARANAQCAINGPDNVDQGERFTLCAPSGYSYRWTGPGVPAAVTSRCITLNGRPSGLYEYTVVLYSGGAFQDRCTHTVAVGGNPSSDTGGRNGIGDCAITGPDSFEPGTRVRLCGPSGAYSYRWTGPGNLGSSSSCITVTREGTYTLRVRDRYGDVRECTHYLAATGGPNDADEIFTENCPRNHAFWLAACRGSRADVSAAELRSIARLVDQRSQAFRWSNQVDGLCQALRPTGPLTQRKQAVRQLAALLANLSADELGITAQNGQTIGLEPDTPISFRNARTIGELATLVDRMLVRGRGSFASINRMMQSVNNGRGIGTVCNE